MWNGIATCLLVEAPEAACADDAGCRNGERCNAAEFCAPRFDISDDPERCGCAGFCVAVDDDSRTPAAPRPADTNCIDTPYGPLCGFDPQRFAGDCDADDDCLNGTRCDVAECTAVLDCDPGVDASCPCQGVCR